MENKPAPIIELAKSGRASCRKCRKPIKKEDLRIGLPAFFRGHLNYRWFHIKCVPEVGLQNFDPELSIEGINGEIIDDLSKRIPERIPFALIKPFHDFLITIDAKVEEIDKERKFITKRAEKGFMKACTITDGQLRKRLIGWNQESDIISELVVGKAYRFNFIQPVENRTGEVEFRITKESEIEEIEFSPLLQEISVEEIFISRSRTKKQRCSKCNDYLGLGGFRIKETDKKTGRVKFFHLGCIEPEYLLEKSENYLTSDKVINIDKLEFQRRAERVFSHLKPDLLEKFHKIDINLEKEEDLEDEDEEKISEQSTVE